MATTVRKLAAIMFTDIVGYTALMGSDEDQAFELLKRNHIIHVSLIKKHNGTLIKELGDGTLASFPLASDAVRCAVDIQQEASGQNIPLKIGIHEGEMVFAGADVLGDGVNIASRLQENAPEGYINISGAVFRDIKNKAGIKTEFIEEKSFKNVDEPIKVYNVSWKSLEASPVKDRGGKRAHRRSIYLLIGVIVLLVLVILWQIFPSKDQDPAPAKSETTVLDKSIAVLPFRNDSPDQENEYFCNGMMEEILDKLFKIGDINVLARTATEKYRNTTLDPREIANELEVANILEGSVRMYGDRFRINVQLIEAESGYHLWSEVFDGQLSDTIFIVQSSIAEEIAKNLDATMTPFELRQIEKIPTTNYIAFSKYSEGRQLLRKFWNFYEKEDLERAERLFRESIEIDPEFSMGYSGLAEIYNIHNDWDSVNYMADKVIEIDPNNSWGYLYKGVYFSNTGEFDKAIANYKKSIDLDPKFHWHYVKLAQIYCFQQNDYLKGLPYMKKAEELMIKQKFYDENLYHYFGLMYSNIGDIENARKYLRLSFNTRPSCIVINQLAWQIGLEKGWEEALAVLDSMCQLTDCERLCLRYQFGYWILLNEYVQVEKAIYSYADEYNNMSTYDSLLLAIVLKENGKVEEAIAISKSVRTTLETQLKANKKDWRTCISLSLLHAILEEKDKSLAYIREASKIGRSWNWIEYIVVFPAFKFLWDDPEFKAIVKRVQQDKAQIRKEVARLEERGELTL